MKGSSGGENIIHEHHTSPLHLIFRQFTGPDVEGIPDVLPSFLYRQLGLTFRVASPYQDSIKQRYASQPAQFRGEYLALIESSLPSPRGMEGYGNEAVDSRYVFPQPVVAVHGFCKFAANRRKMSVFECMYDSIEGICEIKGGTGAAVGKYL
jgi:hypothetical protein